MRRHVLFEKLYPEFARQSIQVHELRVTGVIAKEHEPPAAADPFPNGTDLVIPDELRVS